MADVLKESKTFFVETVRKYMIEIFYWNHTNLPIQEFFKLLEILKNKLNKDFAFSYLFQCENQSKVFEPSQPKFIHEKPDLPLNGICLFLITLIPKSTSPEFFSHLTVTINL
ncbi:hypothetical protein RF11_02693 [Thelohanellus kitauei]|uniref:Uncharacterized protein n=1 Tax=Thelohanellus kitauei TaxID=669202 RepID=A0A0C2J828_THEKT|nr:hypothetical protein RF11_02693 [Thelohanellus kitauei]